MIIRGFFSVKKNKQFNYLPLFYNEEKENFQERVRAIEREMGVNKDNSTEYRPGRSLGRGSIRNYRGNIKVQNKKSAFRFVIIVALLTILAYYLLSI